MCVSKTVSFTVMAFLASTFSPLLAQDARSVGKVDKETKVKSVADYKTAVALLMKLGVPPMKGAKYGKINTTDYSYYGGEKAKIKGNAWVFADEKGKLNQAMLSFAPAKSYEAKGERYSNEIITGRFVEGNLKADIKLCLKQLNDAKFTRAQLSRMEYSETLFTKYFMFGCLAYASGEKEGGRQIIDKIITLVDVEVLLDRVVSKYADRDYQAVYSKFQKYRDWKTYKADVDELIAKYTRGWPTQKALMVLSKKLEQKMAGKELKLKMPKGIVFNQKVLKKVEEIINGKAKKSKPDRYWLINEADSKSSSKQLESFKMDTFIVMASLLMNDYMMDSKKAENSDSYSTYGSHYGSNEFDLDLLYANLKKPPSVGEYAESWIRSAAPHLDKDRSFSKAELKIAAIDWWKKSKDFSQLDLLKEVLAGIEDYDKPEIMNRLANSKDPQSLQFFETTILEDLSPYKYLQAVKEYTSIHKLKVADFASKFVKKMNSSMEPEIVAMRTNKHQKQYLEESIAEIEAYTETFDLEKIFKELDQKASSLSAVKKNMKRLSASLGAEMLKDENRSRLIILAAKFEGERVNSVMETMLNTVPKLEGENKVKISAEESKAWQNLIQKKGKCSQGYRYYLKSIGGQSAFTLEAIKSQRSRNVYRIHGIMGSVGLEKLFVARAKNILAGVTNEKFPSAESVSEDEMKKLLEEFREVELANITKLLDSWSISQQLAFIANEEKGKEIDEIIAKANSYVYEFDDLSSETTESFKTGVKQLVERVVLNKKQSDSNIKELMNYCYSNIGESEGVMLSFSASPRGIGLRLYLMKIDENTSLDYYFNESNKALKSGGLTKYIAISVIAGGDSQEIIEEPISDHWKDLKSLDTGWKDFKTELATNEVDWESAAYTIILVDSKKAMDVRFAEAEAKREQAEKDLLKADESSEENKEILENLTEEEKEALKKALESSAEEFTF